MKQQQKGFTLIELVMVIVIMGILAAVAIPRFFNVAATAQTAARSGARDVAGSAISIAVARLAAAGTYTPPSGTLVAAEIPGSTCAVDTGNIYLNMTGSAFGTSGTIDVMLLTGASAAIPLCADITVGQVGAATFN